MSNNSMNDYDQLRKAIDLMEYLVDGCNNLRAFLSEHMDDFCVARRTDAAGPDYDHVLARTQTGLSDVVDYLYEMRRDLIKRFEEY